VTCKHMLQVKLEDGTMLCAFCEEEVADGPPFVPTKGVHRQITDAEIAALRKANDAAPPEVFGEP
jgi:hypothetical protein